MSLFLCGTFRDFYAACVGPFLRLYRLVLGTTCVAVVVLECSLEFETYSTTVLLECSIDFETFMLQW